ncbi:MAG: Rieske 2Fe-2S domain-containing protein [Woeseiaceae bacterium]
MKKVAIAEWAGLEDRTPQHALVANVDLVIVRFDDEVSVLYGRRAHRGALMSDGFVDGDNLICGLHNWDYRVDTGASEYNSSETLPKFQAWIEADKVPVDEDEISAWADDHPQPFNRDAYQGVYQDPTGTKDEPHVNFIRQLADEGLSKLGHHGPSAAMGVPRDSLPKWDDLQFVVGQLHKLPLLFGTRIFEGDGSAKEAATWQHAYLTMIVVLAPAVMHSNFGSSADAAFYGRLMIFVLATLYAVIAVFVFDTLWPRRSGK